MKTFIEIFTLRDDIDEKYNISQLGFPFIKNNIDNFKGNLKDYYEKKYEYEADFKDEHSIDTILQKVAIEFKLNPPEDFKGTLNYTDIVRLDDREVYYYDNIGWQEL